MKYILRDRLWGQVRNHTKRTALVTMPLLCSVVAINTEIVFALAFGTIGSLIVLIASEPRPPQPTMGRQLYRTTPYLLTNLDPLVAIGAHTPCILFAIEIDGFSAWAQKHSKAAKTAAIISIYDRLASAVRHDDLVVHTADDRFFIAVSMRGIFDINITLSISERLQCAVDPAVLIGERPHYFSITIGIADTQMDVVNSSKDLCRAAIVANKVAQDQGAGQVRFFSQGGGSVKSFDQRPTAPELKQALDRGEIVAHFQPQICGFTGQVKGFEALARWTTSAGKIIPPMKFLDVLKSSGQMTALTDHMISQSLCALKTWNTAGLAVETVSVNLSVDDLNDPNLAKRVKWHLVNAGIDPKHLILEVVENVSVSSPYQSDGYHEAEDLPFDVTIKESVLVKEAKMDRDDFIDHLKTKFGMTFVSTTEEFNGSEGGVWVSGESGDVYKGKIIYNYYSEDHKNYELGVLNRFEKQINKIGWYSEWYDAGTVMIWPL